MNVLNVALPALKGLINNQKIQIINKYVINNNGFPLNKKIVIDTYAHVQPLNANEVYKINSILDSNVMYKFYIIDNLANVLNGINQTNNSIILWNNLSFNIFSKDDYILNGWIKVVGSLVKNENV